MLSPAKPERTLIDGRPNPYYEAEMEAYHVAVQDKKDHPDNWGYHGAHLLPARITSEQAKGLDAAAVKGRERAELEALRKDFPAAVQANAELKAVNERLNAALAENPDAQKSNAMQAELVDLRAALAKAPVAGGQDRAHAVVLGIAKAVFEEYDLKKFKAKAGTIAGFAGLESVTDEELAAAMSSIHGTPEKS